MPSPRKSTSPVTPSPWPIVVEFFAEGRPAAFQRDTAVKSYLRQKATGKRGGHLDKDLAAWRQKVVTEYQVAVGQHPAKQHLALDGSYRGTLALYGEVYGSQADILNVMKEVEDALIGVAFDDDKRIVSYGLIAPQRRVNPKTGGMIFKVDEAMGVVINLMFFGDTAWQDFDPVSELIRNKS